MKSLRDEIRLAAGDMDGFNFIQAFGLDFICAADFILATARISFQKGSVVADRQQLQSHFFIKYLNNLTIGHKGVHFLRRGVQITVRGVHYRP